MTLVEPSCEQEVGPLLDWCVDEATGPAYMRLVSIPVAVNFTLPDAYRPAPGRGVTIRDGDDAVIFAYGPVMLSEAIKAANDLQSRGISVKVINLPWLNCVDHEWLRQSLADTKLIVTIDNHFLTGGQGQMIAAALCGIAAPKLVRLGLTGVPLSGSNEEVLQAHGLDAAHIVRAVEERVTRPLHSAAT
jgi:transketolase